VTSSTTLRIDLDLRDSVGRRLHPQGLVVQEDRNLVIGKERFPPVEGDDELSQAYQAIAARRPLELGRYLVMQQPDLETGWIYQAVIHDFNIRPSTRPGVVRRSLLAVIEDALRRGIHNLAVEPLGVIDDGGLTADEMADAFDAAIMELSMGLEVPLRLTLLLDDLVEVEEFSHLLRSRVLRRASRSFRTVSGDAAIVEVRERDARLHFRFVPGSLSGYMVFRVSNVA
jgi:hypothetical protein